MGRPRKQTVDYFPHVCRHGKTMIILEKKYKNDGYAFWFKLLELLGDTEGHAIDLNDPIAWEFLQSKTLLDEPLCEEILNLLAKLKAIDQNLWENRIVWSDNFIDGVVPAYRNRKEDIPLKPDILRKKLSDKEVSDVINPQSRVEKRREENRRGEERRKEKIYSPQAEASGPPTNNFSIQTVAAIWNELAPSVLSRVNLPFSRPTKKMKILTSAIRRKSDQEWWTGLIGILSQRPFLLGENDRGWKATMDFVIEHAEEIADGKYSGTKAEGLQRQRMAGPLEWLAKQEVKDGAKR